MLSGVLPIIVKVRSSGSPIMWWSTVEIEGIQLQYHTTYINT